MACPSATECVAAGSHLDPSGSCSDAMLLTGFGSSWKAVSVPVPAGSVGSAITGLACPPAADERVAGLFYRDASKVGRTILLEVLGSTWTAVNVPLPAGAAPGGQADIRSMACPTATQCVADGRYIDSSGDTQLMFLTGLGVTGPA